MATVVDHEQLLARAAKATEEKTTYWQRHTPEHSPEREIRELPKETHNDNEKQERLVNLINHIQNAGDNPYNILEVKSSDDFDSRTPRLLKILEEAEEKNVDGAKDALTRARDAQKTLELFFRECQKEIKRLLEEKESSHQVVLQLDKGGTPDERYHKLATFVNPMVFKGKGVDDALKVLNKALAEAKAEDVHMDDGGIQPDTETISLYEEATPKVLQYLRDMKLDAANIKTDLEEINQKISAHNSSLGDDSRELMIDAHGLYTFIQQARPDLELLKNNPQDEQALKRLKKTQSDLLEFNKDNHYPASWVFPLPKLVNMEPKPVVSSGGSPLEQMLGKVPVPTVMELKFAPGETFDAGKIHRYNEFFVKRVKNERGEDTDEIESAVYNFLVENEGRFYIKTGKDIGKAATTAYVAKENQNKFKMGTYYGEERYGIKYNKNFFKELQSLEKQKGEQYLYFIGAARKSSETKSGRTMPSEHCVIGIRHPTIGEWYDVFTRSKLVQLYGDDMNHRISQYWKDLGEKPSQRRPVQRNEEATVPATTSDGTAGNTTSATLQKDFYQLRDKVQSMEGTLGKLSNLENLLATLVTSVTQLTTSVKSLEEKSQEIQVA